MTEKNKGKSKGNEFEFKITELELAGLTVFITIQISKTSVFVSQLFLTKIIVITNSKTVIHSILQSLVLRVRLVFNNLLIRAIHSTIRK